MRSYCVTRVLSILAVCAFAGSANAQWTVSGNDAYFNLSGNVGVGTTTPAFNVHVVEAAGADGTRAIYGLVSSSTGVTNGVFGHTASNAGRGVVGFAGSPTGITFGVYGHNNSESGRGVYGICSSQSGQTYGVYGQTMSTTGRGVYGWAWNANGLTTGVYGLCDSADGIGTVGYAPSTSFGSLASTRGVHGEAAGPGSIGVVGLSTALTTGTRGVTGQVSSTAGVGVQGNALASTGVTAGVVGVASSNAGYGMYGSAPSTSGLVYGVYGATNSTVSGYGVFSAGNFGASGTKSFRIDHPTDPTNKFLLHYCIESPEVLNSYSGTIRLDGSGNAEVALPDYFAAINADPRYALTAVGAPMPLLHVSREISAAALSVDHKAGQPIARCSFSISGGTPGGKVSWRIDAVRNDLWVRTNGAPVEIDKVGLERAAYQHPEQYGKPLRTIPFAESEVKSITERD